MVACAPAATPAHTQVPTIPKPTAYPIPEPTESPKTIVDIAVGDGHFTTLVAALQAAGLVEMLQGARPFNVIVPTDIAFTKLPEGTVESLLK